MQPEPHDVLDFWLGDGLQLGWPSDDRGALWFGGGPELDAQIRQRFGTLVERAIDGELGDWERTPLDRLALVILLDQFTRNVHRGQARAFAGDGRAQRIVLQSLALEQDAELPTVGRVFFYMPLMHAESAALQDECLLKFEALARLGPADLQQKLQGNLRAAHEHGDIIQRFGRFPHRNAVLGRASTPEEIAFLQNGPRFGQ
ncbi:DUF924 family protein [Hydrogenophaga sp.]|uniref:DUF924 family protein n=1 Tax=Hydrogenophaga sp. TaxID=1904254 RepID=UPI0035B2A9A0